MMLRLVLRLLGIDLDYKIAEVRAQFEEFKARTTHQLGAQIKETGLMVGFAFVGAVAAIATFVIVLVALYRWVDLYKGPFAALTAVGVVTGLLAAVMFVLAFRRKPPKPTSAGVDRHAAAVPPAPPVSPPRPVSAALSAALPPLPSNASIFDVLTRRVSTRVAGAGDEAIDAAVHVMRTGSRSALFGTLAVVALVGVMLGRRR
jgi:hypothetical protein